MTTISQRERVAKNYSIAEIVVIEAWCQKSFAQGGDDAGITHREDQVNMMPRVNNLIKVSYA